MIKTVLAAAATLCLSLAVNPASADNLLANSSFRLSANGSTPDYWDLHHAAALQFRDLHSQYNLVDVPGPTADARVLRIINSASGFPFLYLLSRQSEAKLGAGNYVFSVYARSDRPGAQLELAPALSAMQRRVSQTLTQQWRRYSAEFRIDDATKDQLSPLLALPSRASYWISAPQLESGNSATAYMPAATDAGLGTQTAAQAATAAAAIAAMALTSTAARAGLSALFEFNAYTNEPSARLQLSAKTVRTVAGELSCGKAAADNGQPPFYVRSILLNAGQTTFLDIPIGALSPGEYSCTMSGPGRPVTAALTLLAPSAFVVRSNQFRRTLQINHSGYQIRGVMVGSYVPPEWYFADVVDHGINTLFFSPSADPAGRLNLKDLDAVVGLAKKYAMKVIVGPAVMGQKNNSWVPLLERYSDLIRRYRGSPIIIGWFVVDEPQAWTLRENDLRDLYKAIKAIDPYRLAFINWGSDDVPVAVGAEPHGTLAATDLYSIDYYPFANAKTSLESYTLRTLRASKTGVEAGKPAHSWLQLYGYLDAIREPTGEELNYMAYVDLLFGGNYSFWQIKSNAKSTWDRLRKTNEEVAELTQQLMLNPDAAEIQAPILAGHYLYSAWREGADFYLIVLHVSDRTESFVADLQSIIGPRARNVSDYHSRAAIPVEGSTLRDSFNAYATRVYQIH